MLEQNFRTKDESEAKELSEFKNNSDQNKALAKDKRPLESSDDKDELNIIIKSDVRSSGIKNGHR